MSSSTVLRPQLADRRWVFLLLFWVSAIVSYRLRLLGNDLPEAFELRRRWGDNALLGQIQIRAEFWLLVVVATMLLSARMKNDSCTAIISTAIAGGTVGMAVLWLALGN